jgi:uncharacterized membrane protein
MNLYPWIVFLHASGVLLFFMAHGTSMAVGFRLKRERDPARVRALLDLSSWTLGIWPSIAFVVGIVAGIAAGIMGGWFGQAWIWIAIVVLTIVAGAMTPLVAARLNELRTAAGTRAINPFSRKPPEAPPSQDDAELERLLAAWDPLPAAIMGFGGFGLILWLMLFKPF